jgi:hypothetical protein
VGSNCLSSATEHAVLMRKLVRDYRSMTTEELRAAAREAHRREETARYAKGRRAWKSVWQAAEDELRRRDVEVF